MPILRELATQLLTVPANPFRDRFVVKRRMGHRLLLDRDNPLDRLMLKGEREQEQVSYLFKLATEEALQPHGGAVFLDIGAHWGMYALEAHRRGLFEAIIAFETDPTNFAQLQANLFLNGLEHAITTLQLAASNRSTVAGLARESFTKLGEKHVVQLAKPQYAGCQRVRVDEQFAFENKLLAIHVDVKGHEIEVLEGLSVLLAKNRCLVHISANEEVRCGTLGKVIAILAQHELAHIRSIASDHYFKSAVTSRLVHGAHHAG